MQVRNNRKLSYECIRRNMTIKVNKCPACGSNNSEDAYTEYPFGIVIGDEILLGPRTISICKNCGMGYSSETARREAIEPMYAEGGQGDASIQKRTDRNWFKLIEDRRDFVLKDFNDAPPPKNREKYDVCDIGCSGGDFLSVFDSSRWNLFGVEPSPRASRECMSRLNVKVDIGYWEDMEVNEEKWDLIVSTHVLEHCYSPVTFLQNCQKALRENGYLFIEVPDTMHTEWWSICPYNPTHVMHFFLETLVYMVESVGLSPVRWETAYPPQDSGLKDGILRVTARKLSSVRSSGIIIDPNKCIDIIRKKRIKTIKFSQKLLNYVADRLINWVNNDKRIVIYGANHHTANLLLGISEENRKLLEIAAFLDTSEGRIGYKMFGIPVLPFGSPIDPDCILISCRNSEEAMAEHVRLAYPKAEICCPYKEMEPYLSSIIN